MVIMAALIGRALSGKLSFTLMMWYRIHTTVKGENADMFVFKKAVAPFLLPPGIFILLLILSGAWFLKKKKLKAGVLNLSLGCLMWLTTIAPVANSLLRGLESGYDIPETPQGDVIILLGGGVYDQAPDLSGTGVPSEDAMARVVAAVRLQKRLNVPVIASGARCLSTSPRKRLLSNGLWSIWVFRRTRSSLKTTAGILLRMQNFQEKFVKKKALSSRLCSLPPII